MRQSGHTRRLLGGGLTLRALIALLAIAAPARAEVPDTLEPEYAETVLLFNSREFKGTLPRLESMIQRAPDVPEFYELKALCLKALRQEDQAFGVYEKLIELKTRLKRPASEIAPYHFELGMLLQKRNKTEEAKSHFAFAVENDFNLAPSHLYLGLNGFNSGRWDESEDHFRGVLRSGVAELNPIAHFYLGQTYMRLEYPSGATASFVEAQATARSLLEDKDTDPGTRKLAQQIYDATQSALAPYDRGQFFGYLGATSSYDTNVLFIPDTTASAAQTAGKATLKQTLLLGGGYASSSLNTFQLVPSLKGSYNYNFNKDARGAQYATTIASLYLNRKPLSIFSQGLKVDAIVMFKNDYDTVSQTGTYRLFSTTLSAGPYLRYQISRRLLLGVEAAVEPRKFNDDGAGDLRRTGQGLQVRAYAQNERASKYLNPTYSYRYGRDGADGGDFDGRSHSFELNNVLRLTGATELNAFASYSLQSYPRRSSGERKDKITTLQVSGAYRFSPKWTFLSSLNRTSNDSNITDTFSYTRYEVSLGATYAF